MKTIKIPEVIPQYTQKEGGVASFVPHPSKLKNFGIDLQKLYGRDNLCLKIFKKEPTPKLEDFIWGVHDAKTSLLSCTKIQNLFAYYGNIAPKVYDIVLLDAGEKKNFAQVTEYLEGDFGYTPELCNKIKEIRTQVKVNWFADMNPENAIGGKIVDFSNFSFINETSYVKDLLHRSNTIADWGSRTGEVYQDIPELSQAGQRNTEQRMREMQFDKINFKDKTVLDVGGNVGTMIRRALDKGAKKGFLIDLPEVTDVSFEVSNYLGYFNIDYLGTDIKNNFHKIKEKFDVILFLSVSKQIGYTPEVADLCKETLILEGHSGDHDYTYMDILKKDFPKVEYVGITRDHSPRPILVCKKESSINTYKKEIEGKLHNLGLSDPLPVKLPYGIEFSNYQEDYRYPKFTYLNDADAFKGFSPPAKILDLGFGGGFFSVYYAQRGFEVVAVSIDEQQIKRLEYIKELFSFDTLTIVNADITKSFKPFAPFFEDFDLILLLGVIHHLDQSTHLKLLQDCYSTLRKNGAIVIETKKEIPCEQLLKDTNFSPYQIYPERGRSVWRGDIG